jgi:hypothetical protein
MLNIDLGKLALVMHALSLTEGVLFEKSQATQDFVAGLDATHEKTFADLGDLYAARDDAAEQNGDAREARVLERARNIISSLRVYCERIGAAMTVIAIDRALAHPSPLSANSLANIRQRALDELATKHFFALDSKEHRLFNGDDGFTHDVITKFPGAAYDIDEAMKSLALGRSTASVFHMMRITESALRAVHHCLAIPVPMQGNDRNWGTIANRIREEIKTRGKSFAERDLFQEIYARLDAVKDAWRNSTMHVEAKYTSDEAEAILLSVRAFMTKVASRMDENGLPLA